MIHKFAESMSVSIALQRSFSDFRTLLKLILIFSFATPLGTIIGMALGQAPPIVDIVFTSMAAGTFIYVACSEMIVEEFSMPGNRWPKLLAFLIGAIIITCLWFLDVD